MGIGNLFTTSASAAPESAPPPDAASKDLVTPRKQDRTNEVIAGNIETVKDPTGHDVFIVKQQAIDPYDPKERFSTDPVVRVFTACGATFLVGMILGATKEYSKKALQFRAENAHRMPRSQKDWFFYHRTKTNTATAAAMMAAPKTGFRIAGIFASLMVMEESIDHLRGDKSKDFISTVGATMAGAGIYSIWRRHDIVTASLTAKAGFKYGMAIGLTQDVVNVLQGRHIGYVEYIKRMFGSPATQETMEHTTATT